ncbi:chemotaxis protein CheX [Sporohalobacter salinus]|uniref:chemotaxis protein CheX n=1 Tax=Sporohalobacter salinus TaxID=1494606 RepID=UPI00195FE53E|nr:chemotaxis protein CheX [Sporohalobacter salinus]MBM7622670.1 chemotaxis protein CheX [Sporohalobacter salinus]
MKTKHLNPILTATNEILENMLQVNPKKGDMVTKTGVISAKRANISISITGDLSGSILFSFSEDMALSMVEKMSGMEINELDEFVTSAIGELANIISGKAMTYLHEGNYTCDIAPPQVIVGDNQIISMDTTKVLAIPLKTELGEFEVNISITNP